MPQPSIQKRKQRKNGNQLARFQIDAEFTPNGRYNHPTIVVVKILPSKEKLSNEAIAYAKKMLMKKLENSIRGQSRNLFNRTPPNNQNRLYQLHKKNENLTNYGYYRLTGNVTGNELNNIFRRLNRKDRDAFRFKNAFGSFPLKNTMNYKKINQLRNQFFLIPNNLTTQVTH